MSRRVLVILLVISMVFNAAVLLGFLRARARPHSPPAPASMPGDRLPLPALARELSLDDKQANDLRSLQQRQQQQAMVFNDSLQVVRQDLQEELGKPDPDLEQVRTLVDQEADLHRQRRQAEAELYGELVGLLSPDQRKRLGERIGRTDGRPGLPRPRSAVSPDVIRRYDRDRDGRLNSEEARQARTDLENRRREVAPHVPRLPPIWPWFDQDDDGELNATEQADMQKFLSEHRPPRMGPGQQTPEDGRRSGDRRGNRGARPAPWSAGPHPSHRPSLTRSRSHTSRSSSEPVNPRLTWNASCSSDCEKSTLNTLTWSCTSSRTGAKFRMPRTPASMS